MNQREAKQQGFNDGRNFQTAHNRLISQSKSPENMLSQEKYNTNGEYFARQATPYIKARELFLKGWLEAWQESKQPEPIKHFESRFDFCTCEACNARRQPEQIKPELHVCSGCPDGWCATCTPDEQVYSC